RARGQDAPIPRRRCFRPRRRRASRIRGIQSGLAVPRHASRVRGDHPTRTLAGAGPAAMNAHRARLTTEVADIRNAIKQALNRTASRDVTVACSGGPDSLVLAVQTAFVADKLDRTVTAV